ncbi:MAG: molybdopterin-dependent oxidoreductase [Deltaproteobacteria bacterium]|nr:MAG: molybdopterin-dependent oxidoreductase [Deltaproteobacteria bacterium]
MKAKTIIQNGAVPTLCRQCDHRCGIDVHIQNGRIVDLTGSAASPYSRGHICAKGLAAKDLFYHRDRLLKPLKRNPDGTFEEISRDRALDEIAERVSQIKHEYGARSMGVWKGEAVGFFQQLEYPRRFIHAFGSPNYFSNDSVCFNSCYLGYRLVNGFWNNSPEFEHADLIILWATNPPASHPHFMRWIQAARKRGAKLILIDHRLNRIASKADLVARPLPGTDGALGWGLNRYLIETGNYDRELVEQHSIGFGEFSQYARTFAPEFVERQTGVDRRIVIEIAEEIIRNSPRVVIYPGVGLEHHENGVNTVRTLATLGCLCGSLDVQGGLTWAERLETHKLTLYDELPLLDQKPIGANRFPVLYDFRRECHSMTAMDHMLGKGEYPLQGLIITAANPAITNPNSNKVVEALSRLDLLVVNDLFLTKTAKLAHYVLPAATFLERSELHYHRKYHLVTLTRKVAEIPGVYDEYSLWRDLAYRLGFGEQYFPWKNEEEVTRWLLEPTGITVEELEKRAEGFVYKPVAYRKHESQPLPTPSGKVEFCSSYLKDLGLPEIPEYVPPRYIRDPNQKYPFVLTTGARKPLLYHSRYHNISHVRRVYPVAEVEVHPTDAVKLGIEDKEQIRVVSEIGSVEVQAKIVHDTKILPGVLEMAHGWVDANVNLLTYDNINDPISGFPLLKAVPVRVEKIECGPRSRLED